MSKIVVGMLALLIPADNGSCIGCHGNAALSMDVGTEKVPLHVDAAAYASNEHALVRCGGCHTDMNPLPPHDATRIYGSWSRFSVKDMKFNSDGSPRAEVKVIGSDGIEYTTNENFVANDCERCHMNTNCGTCHWKSTVTQKSVGDVLDLWFTYTADADTTKGAQTEYGMDWTVNVASHDFRGSAELTSSNEVCTACHKDLHDLVLQNNEEGGRTGGDTKCENCHADRVTATHQDVACIACHAAELGVHRESTGTVYPYALKHSVEESWPTHNLTKDVQCTKCHYADNPLGVPASVTPFAIH